MRGQVVAGLLSGTSMDGVDVCLCRIDPDPDWGCELLAFETYPYPADLRLTLSQDTQGSLEKGALWQRQLGEVFADALETLLQTHRGLVERVDLIGSHGQTLYHRHRVTTLQLGEAAHLAARFGCPVVSDFRVNDIAVGGCGAPLVPYVDHRLFSRLGRPNLVVNLGGIANFTALPGRPDTLAGVQGFDCGPGNMVLDQLTRLITRGAQSHDVDGQLAAQGRVQPEVLAQLMAHPFVSAPPPKSAGREQFGAVFMQELVNLCSPGSFTAWVNLLATATRFTAAALYQNYCQFIQPQFAVTEVIVSGGGVHNRTLMAEIQACFGPIPVVTSDTYGVPSDAKEAMAFAILAAERMAGRPTNVPAVTGASRPVQLGKITEL